MLETGSIACRLRICPNRSELFDRPQNQNHALPKRNEFNRTTGENPKSLATYLNLAHPPQSSLLLSFRTVTRFYLSMYVAA